MVIFVNNIDSYFSNIHKDIICKLIFELGCCMVETNSKEESNDVCLIKKFNNISVISNKYGGFDKNFDEEIKLVSGTYKEIFDFLVDKI